MSNSALRVEQDSSHAVKKAAEVAINGPGSRGLSTGEWLTALRELGPEVVLTFSPEDQLRPAILRYDGETFQVDGVYSTPDDWDESALKKTEAGALLDGATLIQPATREEC